MSRAVTSPRSQNRASSGAARVETYDPRTFRSGMTGITQPLRVGELDLILIVAKDVVLFEVHPPRIEDGDVPEVEA